MVNNYDRPPRYGRKLRGFRNHITTAQQKNPVDHLQASNHDGNKKSVIAPEERMDRTLSLRNNLSTDERSCSSTIDEAARFPSENKGDFSTITTSNDHCNEAFFLTPPMAITYNDANSDGVDAESKGYCQIKTRLRSKLLKSKISHLRRTEETCKPGEPIDGGDSKSTAVPVLQRFPSHIQSVKSESSTLKTPKITNRANARQKLLSSTKLQGHSKPNEESEGKEDENLMREHGTNAVIEKSNIRRKSCDSLTQLVLQGCDDGTQSREVSRKHQGFSAVQITPCHGPTIAAEDSFSLETSASLSTEELLLSTRECCCGWVHPRGMDYSTGSNDDESTDTGEDNNGEVDHCA